MEPPDPDAVLHVATEAADRAVELQRAHLGRVPVEEWGEKGLHDFVTTVDRDAEAAIVERIREDFPDHRFLAEEAAAGGVAGGGPFAEPGWLWVIDPLDGTTNYLHRYPMYSVSIAAFHDGRPVAAVVMNGASGEVWTALAGRGAYRDGQPIRVSSTNRLGHALIGTGFPFKAPDRLPEYLVQFERVLRHCAGIRRAGSAALDLCHLATGWFDGFWELVLAPWDLAAGTLIVREAGGIVTRLDGSDDVYGGGSVLAGNASVHAALAALLIGHES